MKEQLQGNQPGQLRKGILARMPSLFENRTGHGRFFDDPLALCKQFQLHLPLSRIASRRACYSPGTEQWDKGPLAHAKSCQARGASNKTLDNRRTVEMAVFVGCEGDLQPASRGRTILQT